MPVVYVAWHGPPLLKGDNRVPGPGAGGRAGGRKYPAKRQPGYAEARRPRVYAEFP